MGASLRRTFVAVLALLGLSQPAVLRADPLRDSATARNRLIGAAVNMTPFGNETPYRDTLSREFNVLVAENAMKMDAMRPSRTTFNFTDADALVAFAEANGMAVRGHVLIWHSQIPQWLVNGTFTRDEMIEIMRDHIHTVVGRYAGRIDSWDVVNEAISDSNGQPRDSLWRQRIGPEYIAMAFQFAREADSTARLYYNDYEAEGSGAKSDAVFNLVSGLVSQGVPINGVGWQWHKINGSNATITSAHTANAARIANLGLELTITEADVRIQLPSAGKLQQQANEYGSLWSFCLNTAICRGVVTWGFTDKYSWVPGFASGFGDALIFDTNYQPKPAYLTIQGLLEQGQGNPPPAPTGVSASAGNGQGVIMWPAVAEATSYNVKRSTTSGGPYTTVGTTTGTSFTATGLTNGTTFFFVVTAVNANGESPNSNQVSVTPTAGNFSLAANPASLSVNRGSAGPSTISIVRTNFTSSVTLSASGLPTGVTASFNPISTTGTSSALTLNVASNATLGAATITVTATGGSQTRTTSIVLTVAGSPDFTLSPSPASLTVNRSASGTSTINIQRTSFTSSVTLSATGLPSGVTATFSPMSTTGNSSTLTLAASSTAALGTVNVTVTGTGGSLTRSATLGLTVANAGGNGGVTVTRAVTANGPWFNEQVVRIDNTGSLTSLSVTIVVQRTTGVGFSGQYNTVGGQIQQGNTGNSNASTVTYTWTLAAGQTLGAGTNRTFAAQTGGNGTVHPTSGDTYTVTYTSGGQTFTRSGTF